MDDLLFVVPSTRKSAHAESQALIGRVQFCAHCGTGFVHLDSTHCHGSSLGIDDGRMIRAAGERLRAKMRAFAHGPPETVAACPDCGRYQPAMIAAHRGRCLVTALKVFALAAAAATPLAILVPFVTSAPAVVGVWLVGGVALVAGMCAAVIGLSRGPNSGSRHEGSDPLARPLAEFTTFAEACLGEGVDPLHAWGKEVMRRRELGDVVTTLGLMGEVPPSLGGLASERVLAELEPGARRRRTRPGDGGAAAPPAAPTGQRRSKGRREGAAPAVAARAERPPKARRARA